MQFDPVTVVPPALRNSPIRHVSHFRNRASRSAYDKFIKTHADDPKMVDLAVVHPDTIPGVYVTMVSVYRGFDNRVVRSLKAQQVYDEKRRARRAGLLSLLDRITNFAKGEQG